MNSSVLLLALGGLLLASGFATYFIPLGLEDKRPIPYPLSTEPRPYDLEGVGSLVQRFDFNETLPPQAQDARFNLALALNVTVESIGPGPPLFEAIANATVGSASNAVLQFQVQGFNNTTLPRAFHAPLAGHCPCADGRLALNIDLYARQNATDPYHYRFTYENSTLELVPADRDKDGVLDTAQWWPAIPQYAVGFPLTVLGGVAVARAFMKF